MASKKVKSRKAAKKRKPIRTDTSYIASATALSRFVPKLKKFKNRERLNKKEKRQIAYREKKLRYVKDNLIPVTKLQAKRLGRAIFSRDVQAVVLKDIEPGSTLKISKHGDIEIIEPNRHWLFWRMNRQSVKSKTLMKLAGFDAYSKTFPLELLRQLGADAFKILNVRAVQLWSKVSGAVGRMLNDYNSFERFINDKWQAGRYLRAADEGGDSDVDRWVEGLVILLETPEQSQRRREREVSPPAAIEVDERVEAILRSQGADIPLRTPPTPLPPKPKRKRKK